MQTLPKQYGSDPDGLVWCYHFSPEKAGKPMTTTEAAAFIKNDCPECANEFIWLHFSLSNSSSEKWLRSHLDLPETFYESLGCVEGSTRIEQDGEALVAVLHDLLFDFSMDPAAISTAMICIKPKFLVSLRLQPLRSVEELHIEVKKGEQFRSSVALLTHLLQDQGRVFESIQRKISTRVDQIEDELLTNKIKAKRSELGTMRRTLVRLQRLLAPEPAAFFRLLNRPQSWIHKEDLQSLQQAAEEFAAVIADSVSLVERVKLVQEELGAFVIEQSNQILFVLTIVTVLALPINLVAGLFGMNVGGIPLAENPSGFWVVIGLLFVLTMLLVFIVVKKTKS